MSVIDSSIASGPTLVNSAVEASLLGAGDGVMLASTSVVGAEGLAAGQIYRLSTSGRLSTAGSSPGTLTLRFGMGNLDTVLTTGALPLAAGLNGTTWLLEALMTVRVVGASGQLLTAGRLVGVTAAAAVNPVPASGLAPVSFDTRSPGFGLFILALFGTASPSNSITCDQWVVEAL